MTHLPPPGPGDDADRDIRAGSPAASGPDLATLLGRHGRAGAAPFAGEDPGCFSSPPFRDGLSDERFRAALARHAAAVQRRFDTLERHLADLMLLVASVQELMLGTRREFSGRSRALICKVAAAPPFAGRCPCCGVTPVLTKSGQPVPQGAEFDHFFARGLNRPEHGWLICRPCHVELTRGGYMVRFSRMPEFRGFQSAVLEHRRRTPCTPFPAAKAGT